MPARVQSNQYNLTEKSEKSRARESFQQKLTTARRKKQAMARYSGHEAEANAHTKNYTKRILQWVIGIAV